MGGKPYPANLMLTSSKDSATAGVGETAPAMYTESSAPHDLGKYISTVLET